MGRTLSNRQSLAESYVGYINAAPMLEYLRRVRRMSQVSTLVVDNSDKQEYQFHFSDDSILIIDQVTRRARVETAPQFE